MKYENIKKRELRDQVEGYIRAIQWNLHYYYHGCCSWNWYYPHHYAPYVSDLRNFSELKIEFELSEPFHPFEQLLAVLPAASAGCLPVPFQHLMKDESSPIIDFYPEKFSTDLNGKKNDWEAVVLIPFIDENRLLTAMADCEPQLTDEERQRNSYGPHLLFTSGAEPSTLYSTFPTLFQDLNSNTAKREEVDMNTFRIPISKIVYGLLPGVKLDVFFPGFPTMKHIPHVAELRNANVRVFQQPTQKPSMILCVSRRTEFKDLDEVSSRLVGLEVHVEWPFLKHGLVHEIWTKERRYALDKETQELTVTELSAEDSSRFAEYVTITTAREFGRYGIDVVSKDAIALVRSSIGVHYCVENKEMTLKRQWSEPDAARPYSLDLIVQNVIENDSICSSAALNVEEAFPVNSTLFIISHSLSKYYGMKATIKQNNISSKGELIVSCCLPKANLDCQYLIEKCHPYTNRWFSLHQVSRHTLLPRHVIALLTSTVLICPTKRPIVLSHRPTNKVNIGLEIKSTKRNLAIPDFAKKGNGEYWQYSKRTLLVIEEYKRRFPEVLCYLEHSSRSDLCYADDIWPSLSPADSEKKISEIRQFLSELPISSTKMERADSVFLDSSVIKEIERQIDNHALQDNNRYQKLNVKPSAIFSPILQSGNCVPDIKADYRLYDRVVYVRKSSTVPLGLCGTIVGIIGPEEDRTFDVVFDKPFLGGKSIHGSKASGIRLKPSTLINISYGGRMRQPKTMLEGKTTNLKTKDSSNINSEVSVICQSSRSSAGRDTVFSQLFHVSEDNIDKVTQNVSETFGKPIVVMVGKGRIPVSSTGNKAEKHRIPGRMGTERAVQMGIQKKDCTTRSSLRTTATPFASDKRSEGEIKVNKSEGSVWQKLFPVSAEGFSDTSSSHEKCEQDTRSWTNSNQHDVVKTLLDSLSKFNLDNKSGEMNCKKKSPDTFLPPQRFSLVGASEKDKFQFPQVAVTWPPPRPPPLPINQSASHVLPFRPCHLMPHSFNTSKGQCSGIRAQNYDVSRNMVANSYFSSAPFPCRPQLHPSILRNTQTQPPLHSTQEFAHHLDRHELKTRPLSSARALRQIPPRMDRSHQGKQRWFGFARNGRGYLSNDGRQKCVRGAVDEQYIGIRTPSDMIPTQVIRKRNRSKRMVLTEKMNRDKPATSKESPFEKENTRKKEEERKKKEKEGKTVRDEEIEEEGCRQTEGCGYHEESRNQAKTETGSQPIHRKRRTRVAANL
ncbi:hypothetical protein AB6A40_000157 [Gnathostoma spinigerum]|uniref:Uncharacterized protein n=1 Tax=Gnathostoma spinigerum TaxID=75299 RepID=A0ABD6E1K8_9BILA